MADEISSQLLEAAILVCGRALHYKSRMRTIMLAAGVPQSMYDRYDSADAYKFTIARHVLDELTTRGVEGQKVIRRLISDLANLTKPEEKAPDQAAGRAAIAELRRLATEQRVIVDTQEFARRERAQRQQIRQKVVDTRTANLAKIRESLNKLANSNENPQSRGYELEGILVKLFSLYEISYRPSYRTAREQLDGAFEYKGLTYLVEERTHLSSRSSLAFKAARFRRSSRL
ncbi:hypothetical protein [Kutzneria sp. NPDC051319]|uniref:hypothetical protein n=1 Tax=Kutzneria sp. NPDC051319 TaxID=3155047 RepID=UPI0034200A28